MKERYEKAYQRLESANFSSGNLLHDLYELRNIRETIQEAYLYRQKYPGEGSRSNGGYIRDKRDETVNSVLRLLLEGVLPKSEQIEENISLLTSQSLSM